MMLMTTIISSKVNPRALSTSATAEEQAQRCRAAGLACGVPRFVSTVQHQHRCAPRHLPVLYFVPSSLRFATWWNIENALSPPGIGFGIILHRAHSPLLIPGHGVDRDRRRYRIFFPPCMSTPLTRVSKYGGYPSLSDLGLDRVPVGILFVAVNGVAHLHSALRGALAFSLWW